MTVHERVRAGYCAMRALNIALALPNLNPVVARGEDRESPTRSRMRLRLKTPDAQSGCGRLRVRIPLAAAHPMNRMNPSCGSVRVAVPR